MQFRGFEFKKNAFQQNKFSKNFILENFDRFFLDSGLLKIVMKKADIFKKLTFFRYDQGSHNQ